MVNTEKFISQSITEIRTAAGTEKVVMALSGGCGQLGLCRTCSPCDRG